MPEAMNANSDVRTRYCGGPNFMLVYNHQFVHTHYGKIAVEYYNQGLIRAGYLSKDLANGQFKYTSDESNAAIFKFDHNNIAGYTSYVRVSLDNATQGLGHPYLGLALGSTGGNIQPSSYS